MKRVIDQHTISVLSLNKFLLTLKSGADPMNFSSIIRKHDLILADDLQMIYR